jgi:hypothetical protein
MKHQCDSCYYWWHDSKTGQSCRDECQVEDETPMKDSVTTTGLILNTVRRVFPPLARKIQHESRT